MTPSTPATNETEAIPAAPLNRKYRPQSFDSAELVGQDHIVRTLKNAIRMNRVAQAYLFSGPRGTGKTSTARILAKAVNCLDPDPDKRPCNVCSACVAINSGATPDVIEIDAASNRGIDDIRDLRERVNYAPTQLRTKFYIIDEAHQITGAAANAFLKTLEEPPAHTRFVLATTDPEELLPTIVSRCQRFDFRRHTVAGIASRIRVLADRESIQLTDDAVQLVAELAHGSMRDPVGLLEQLSNFQSETGSAGDQIDADAVRELVGMTRSEIAIRIVSAIGQRDATGALAAINEAVEAGQDIRQLNRQIVSLIRDGLQVASGLQVLAYQDELKALAGNLSVSDLVDVAAAFLDTDSQIRSSVMPHLPLELAVLKSTVARAAPGQAETRQPAPPPPKRDSDGSARSPERRTTPPEQNTNPVPIRAESVSEPAPVNKWTSMARNRDAARTVNEPHATDLEPSTLSPAPNSEPEKTESITPLVASVPDDIPGGESVGGELSIESLIDMWPNVRADIKSLDRRTEALMLEIDPIDVMGDRITLASPYEFHRNMLNVAERRATLEDVISRRTGRTVRVEVVLKSDFLAARVPQISAPSVPAASRQPESASVVESAPATHDDEGEKYLGAVIRMFDGEIIEETIDES